MINHHYKVERVPYLRDLDAILQSYGSDGWEVVSMLHDGQYYVIVFKKN